MDSEELRARVERSLIDAIDEWRRAQAAPPSRPEAIRQLLKIGLLSEQRANEDA